jgi:hypothetical protein
MTQPDYPDHITFKEFPGNVPNDTSEGISLYATSIRTASTILLVGPNDIVAPGTFRLTITYPLKRNAIITVNETGPITRAQFAKIIFDAYARIYREEDESTATPAAHIPNMLNRNQTDGKYGIWGHDIGDLVLVAAYKHDDGTYHLNVDS